MKKLLFIAALFLCSPAYATVGQISDLPSTITIDGDGTLGGAQQECFYLFPTTPDADVVADTDIYRVFVSDAFTFTSAVAYVNVTGTTDAVTIDLNEAGTTLLSTKLTLDAGENSSRTAAAPAVISDSAIAAGSVISLDVDDQDGGNTAAGLQVVVCGYYN